MSPPQDEVNEWNRGFIAGLLAGLLFTLVAGIFIAILLLPRYY